MEWTDIQLVVSVDHLEKAAEIATMVAGAGIYIEDYSDLEQGAWEIAHIDLIDEDLLAKNRQEAIIHIYQAKDQSPAELLSFMSGRLEELEIPYRISMDNLREEDWATAWKKYYHPFSLTDKLAVCPSWEEYQPKAGQKVITLDPGMAFGTGTHDTTQLCLCLLEKYMVSGEDMLDIGTGSGILAIGAKLLGSGRTLGVDIDPVAVRVAKENAEINKVVADFSCSDLVTEQIGQFDVICANIVADVIIRLAPTLPALLKAGGRFIASGIIDTRKDDVLTAVEALGLYPKEIMEQKGWVAICFTTEK